jgi:hypothetical protein
LVPTEGSTSRSLLRRGREYCPLMVLKEFLLAAVASCCSIPVVGGIKMM